MNYLARLRAMNSEKRPPKGLQKLQDSSFDSFYSTHNGHFQEIEAAANRYCDVLGDNAEQRAEMLADVRQFPPARWSWLIEYFNSKVQEIEQAAFEGQITDDRRCCHQ